MNKLWKKLKRKFLISLIYSKTMNKQNEIREFVKYMEKIILKK